MADETSSRELEGENAILLPDREAMSLLTPDTGLMDTSAAGLGDLGGPGPAGAPDPIADGPAPDAASPGQTAAGDAAQTGTSAAPADAEGSTSGSETSTPDDRNDQIHSSDSASATS